MVLGAGGAQGVHGIALLQVWMSPRRCQGWVQIPHKILLSQLFLFNELQNPLIHFLSFYYQLQVPKYFPICLLTVQCSAFPAQQMEHL